MFSYTRFDLAQKQKAIFVHIPRTGGTALSRHFYPHASRMFLPHATASFISYHLGEKLWDKMFTFAFVRNPWERIVSWYLFYTTHRTPDHFLPFSDFVKRDPMIMGSFAHNGWLDSHLWSQSLFLTSDGSPDGKVMVDFVGKYETFDKDVKYICDKLELPMITKEKNATGDSYRYQDFYNEETKALVAERCKWEIDQFGYKYEEE